MKKALLFVLFLSLLASVVFMVAGGEKEVRAAEKIRIVHIHWTQPPYDKINVGSAKSFTAKHPNVKVKFLMYADADLPTKVRTALLGGEVDTFAMPNLQSAWFMANDLCAEIIPSAFGKQTVQEVIDMWEPNAVKKCGGFYNGVYYGIPHEMSNYVAWINKAHMREAGLNPETDIPKTWKQFVDVCKKLTKDKGGVRVRNGFAINLKAPVFSFLVLHSLMEQKGLDWSTEKGLLASLDTKEAVEALTTFTDWAVKDDIFDPNLFDNERRGFGNGLTSTFLTGGTWYWGVLDEYTVPREDVTPFPYPRYKSGKDIGGPVYGYSVFVAKQSEHKKWAWKWLNYLERQPEAYIVHGYYQPRKSLDPALANKYILRNDVFGTERKKGATLLASPKFNEIQDAVGVAVNNVIFRGMSDKEAIRILKKKVKSILE